ncbi:hypothetical protein [Piscinibacter koreensis]|uniref:hypothetical protein n=1 Tax=Piscinibacter koreensis TaxID=2742824 RepID=UPI003158BB71
MKLTPARVDVVVWSSIYGGLLVLGLGLAVQRELPAAGWVIAVVGGLAALLGVVLIGVRSRMTDPAAKPDPRAGGTADTPRRTP